MIAEYTYGSSVGLSIYLDKAGLGKELSNQINNPDLIAEVFNQLSDDESRVYVGKSFVENSSDSRLVEFGKTEKGGRVVTQIAILAGEKAARGEEKISMEGVQLRINNVQTLIENEPIRVDTTAFGKSEKTETEWFDFKGRRVDITEEDRRKAQELLQSNDDKWKQYSPEQVAVIVAQNKYNNIITDAVAEGNVSWLNEKTLKSLLIQESDFRPKVINSAGYAGIAQIGKSDATDKKVGLIVSKQIDERLIPEKAIPAAVRILKNKENYLVNNVFEKYGTPTGDEYAKFVLASYNAGEGAIKDAMKYSYEAGLKEAKSNGLDGSAAEGYARSHAARFENLFKHNGDIAQSPIHKSAMRWGKPTADKKYKEISEYAPRILERAGQ